MDPISLSMIAIGGSAAAGGVSALGQILGGIASKNQYGYQSAVARINQQIAKQNADYARNVGEVEAQKVGLGSRFRVGNIVAGKAAAGLDVNTGSASDVVESQKEIGLHDQATVRANAAKKAYGFEVEGVQHEAQSHIYDMAGDKAMMAGIIGAGSSILGSASSVSSKWLDAKRYGIYDSNTEGGWS